MEDDDRLLKAFVRILEDEFDVVGCSDGMTASDRLRREMFDVVVADQHLPDATGEEIVQIAERTQTDIGKVIITGDPDVKVDLLTLSKPVSADRLIAVIRALATK